MRHAWPILGTTLILALVGTLSAQQPVTFNTGFKPAKSKFQTVDMNAMLPNLNVNRAMLGPQNSSRKFDFSRFLPNLSFMGNWTPRRVHSDIDPKYFGPYYQPPKKK